jgi:hypothetical protein
VAKCGEVAKGGTLSSHARKYGVSSENWLSIGDFKTPSRIIPKVMFGFFFETHLYEKLDFLIRCCVDNPLP